MENLNKLKFKKYPSIENHTKVRTVHSIKDSQLYIGAPDLFIATSKVHGANFAFYYNGKEHKYAKRTSFCDDNFYSCYKLEKYREDIEKIYLKLVEQTRITDGETLIVYGEIFGGSFFGESDPNAKNVQRGMNYHPDTEFIAFDICLGHFWHDDFSYSFLPFTEVEELLRNTSIKLVPVIFKGTLEECVNLDNEYITVIPSLFGLELPEGAVGSIEEGYVIRHYNRELTLSGGSRAMLKSKNTAFGGKGGKVIKVQEELSESDLAIIADVSVYIDQHRLESVLSKDGEFNQKNIGKYIGFLTKDAIEEYQSDNYLTEDFRKSCEQVKPVMKALHQASRDVVISYMNQI